MRDEKNARGIGRMGRGAEIKTRNDNGVIAVCMYHVDYYTFYKEKRPQTKKGPPPPARPQIAVDLAKMAPEFNFFLFKKSVNCVTCLHAAAAAAAERYSARLKIKLDRYRQADNV